MVCSTSEIDAWAIVERLQERYDALWAELTSTEEFTTQEMWRIEQRIERLNELGFDVDELDIVTDWDGETVRVQPRVVEAGHHRRELQWLTGLYVEDNQARRLLNDIAGFTAQRRPRQARNAPWSRTGGSPSSTSAWSR